MTIDNEACVQSKCTEGLIIQAAVAPSISLREDYDQRFPEQHG